MSKLTEKQVLKKIKETPNKEWIKKIDDILKQNKISNNDKKELNKLYNNIKNLEKDNFLYITKEKLDSMLKLLKIKVDIGEKKINNSEIVINEEINMNTYNNLSKLGIPKNKIGDFINIFAKAVGINNNNGKITNKLADKFNEYQERKDGGVLGKNIIGNIIISEDVDVDKIKEFLVTKDKKDLVTILKKGMENKYSDNIKNILDKILNENILEKKQKKESYNYFSSLSISEFILIKFLIKSEV